MRWENLLEQRLYHNSSRAWAIAIGIALVTMVAIRLARWIVENRLSKLATRTSTGVDDVVVLSLKKTKWFFYVSMGVLVGSLWVKLPDHVDDWIVRIAALATIVQLGVWLSAAVKYGSEYYEKHADANGSTTVATAARFVGRLIVWSLVVILVLSNLGVEISALVAGLGVGGVAAALAVQSVLGDLFSSLSLYIDRPFDIGDFIIVDDLMGTVDYIGMRSTRIRSLGGEQLVFSNSDLTKARIKNYKRMTERRIVFSLGVVYGTPYEKLRRIPDILREIIESQEKVRFDRSHFFKYGDYSLIFEVVYYVLSPDYMVYMNTQQVINFEIYRRFEAEGLVFAFPTQSVHVESMPASPVSKRSAA